VGSVSACRPLGLACFRVVCRPDSLAVVWLERGESTSTIQECPPRFTTKPEGVWMTIMIGIDPHKATHTAFAVDESEVVLGEFKVFASKAHNDACRCRKLVRAPWPGISRGVNRVALGAGRLPILELSSRRHTDVGARRDFRPQDGGHQRATYVQYVHAEQDNQRSR
jgi:hypothetical protein